jgi:3-oxoacyl-[acyl-carrier-protein] synthase III
MRRRHGHARWEDWNSQKIAAKTGIQSRHFADLSNPRAAVDLATDAARQAIARAPGGIDTGKLACVYMATVESGLPAPSVSTSVLGRLGSAHSSTMTCDITAGCSGGVAALRLALKECAEHHESVIVGGVDLLSRSFGDNPDPGTALLFGDGAGCAVARMHPNAIRPAFACLTSPDEDVLHMRNGVICMNGRGVRTFVENMVPGVVRQVALKAGVGDGDRVDWSRVILAPHQANSVMLGEVASRLHAPTDRVLLKSVRRHGNTSSASVFLALNEEYEDRTFPPGPQIVIFVGVGAGMAVVAAACTVELEYA